MTTLTRDQILHADDLKRVLVKVPEWNGEVYVRSMTGKERDAFELSMLSDNTTNKRENMRNLRARMASLTMVDEEGKRLFSEKDVEALGGKSGAALDRVFDAAQKLNAITDEDVEDIAKNSDGRGVVSSISASA